MELPSLLSIVATKQGQRESVVLISPVNHCMLFVFIASSMFASLAEAQPPLLRQSSCMADTGFRSFSPGNTADAGYIDKDCMCASDHVAFEA